MAGRKKVEKEGYEITFTKEQLLSSERYKDKRDLLNALLNPDSIYSISKVDELIGEFMKGKVN